MGTTNNFVAPADGGRFDTLPDRVHSPPRG